MAVRVIKQTIRFDDDHTLILLRDAFGVAVDPATDQIETVTLVPSESGNPGEVSLEIEVGPKPA